MEPYDPYHAYVFDFSCSVEEVCHFETHLLFIVQYGLRLVDITGLNLKENYLIIPHN